MSPVYTASPRPSVTWRWSSEPPPQPKKPEGRGEDHPPHVASTRPSAGLPLQLGERAQAAVAEDAVEAFHDQRVHLLPLVEGEAAQEIGELWAWLTKKLEKMTDGAQKNIA